MTARNNGLNKQAHFLVDNRLIHTFRALFETQTQLPEEMVFNSESLILLQFFEDLILFDKIIINSTVFGPIFEENKAFLDSRFKKFTNIKDLFLFENFSQKLTQSSDKSINITFGHFELIKNIESLSDLYEDIDQAHIVGIRESYEFISKFQNENLEYICEQIRGAEKFYGRNFFLAILRNVNHYEAYKKMAIENSNYFMIIITCMFVYFSFYLNRLLARIVGGDYSPIFSRENFVKRIQKMIDVEVNPIFKEMVDKEFKKFYRDSKKTTGLGELHPLYLQMGMINKQVETPIFGLAVYRSAKCKTLDYLLQEAINIRQDDVTKHYRIWLHQFRNKNGILLSRKAELDEIIDILSRKFGLIGRTKISTLIIDWFNPFSILKCLVGKFEELTLVKKPQVTFLSNISKRLLEHDIKM